MFIFVAVFFRLYQRKTELKALWHSKKKGNQFTKENDLYIRIPNQLFGSDIKNGYS